MPQLETVPNPCPKCSAEFEAQRTSYCREFLRYQRENYTLRAEFNEDRKKRDQEILRHQTQVNALWTSNKALEAELKHALEKLLKAERELIQAWKTSQHAREGFNAWWDAEYDDSDNRFEKDSAAYWAWAGWQAAQPQQQAKLKETPKCSQA